MSDQHYLEIPVKARYYTHGNLNDTCKHIIIAFHGYGQLASYFIRHFEQLGPEYFIIVPEGMHRFYLQGMQGRVGASWMTKEDREVDIENQSAYINALLAQFGSPEKLSPKLCILGFSQGVATAMRWILFNKIKVNAFIIWAGSMPPDLKAEEVKEAFSSITIPIIIGNKDPYFQEEVKEQQKALIERYQLHAKVINYEGEHRLDARIVKDVLKTI